jgi:hypothetical protein
MSTTEILLRVKDMDKIQKKTQVQKFKMADESNMAPKTFFSD